MRALALAILMATPAAAHDTLRPEIPSGTVVVMQPLFLDNHRTGAGPVRLVTHPHSPQVAARLTVPEYTRYQNAYRRALTHLSFHMPVHRAEREAHHRAWHAVVAPTSTGLPTSFVTDPIPRR
ncbi:hypothetical protein [Jannaschia aquimarina]|uniref:Uncharacterized protein n=1 Tax=Jannaschia aquimarina TaxID=935700 RepID=A0A0D1EJ08_9RHOB|nr:hypothetical protein [Jannaschia aquimarina]KIT16926.1 hypothetical protein jaqu_14250 [Jannaschia aquimarina]SNT11453.1 hypothetical protein SAMN05421775_10623 [Jannaschia aquimarina]